MSDLTYARKKGFMSIRYSLEVKKRLTVYQESHEAINLFAVSQIYYYPLMLMRE